MQQLIVVSEVRFNENPTQVTFVDLISENTFLIGIFEEEKKERGINKLKVYQRGSMG
jgi:hypothetical protein